MGKDLEEQRYKDKWINKSLQSCIKELNSWHKHMDKHSTGYAWTNSNPEHLNDADRVLILKEIIRNKREV